MSTTTTKTEIVDGVTTITTTVKAPGQPTKTTIKKIITKKVQVPAGQTSPEAQRVPQQLSQPQPQGRPQSPAKPEKEKPEKEKPEKPEKRISGLFSSLKKVLPKRPGSPNGHAKRPSSPGPTPKQSQPQYQQPQPQYPSHHSQPPTPQPTNVVRIENGHSSVDPLIEKLHLVDLQRPQHDHHQTSTTTTTTTPGRKVISHKISSYHAESPDDAISALKKCRTVVAPDFGGQRLDVGLIDFSREDAHARACPSSETASIARLSHYLTSPMSGDKVSQLRAIFTWIADNIAYDVPSFLSGRYPDQSAEAVLRTRQSVCEGYSNLFIALAEPAGLEVQKVIGLARGVDVQVGEDRMGSPHAWNAVTIEGEYLMIDSTWGAGVCDLTTRSFRKSFRPFFFLLRPNKMIYSHWPENPKQQFLDPPVNENTFRGLPAIKPEAWTLGIKLAGKNRSQVIRTRDDYLQVDIRLKKRPSDGATGKIVARLHWKGKAIPTAVQWQREDNKYVIMSIKTWCPSSGTGELHVYGWPPGGDQTKNGPECLNFKVVNEGSGRAAKALLQQYVVNGFAFSVLEPMTAQISKNTPQTIRIRVFDVEKGITPALALQGPEGGMPERIPQIQPGLFEMTKVFSAGQWKIVHMTSEYGFSFAAVFDAV